MLCLRLRIIHMFAQPGGRALAIVVDDVVGQRTDQPVYANQLADWASVERRVCCYFGHSRTHSVPLSSAAMFSVCKASTLASYQEWKKQKRNPARPSRMPNRTKYI